MDTTTAVEHANAGRSPDVRSTDWLAGSCVHLRHRQQREFSPHWLAFVTIGHETVSGTGGSPQIALIDLAVKLDGWLRANRGPANNLAQRTTDSNGEPT